jgi:RimJ/RimL family protein N-acetyltransferase
MTQPVLIFDDKLRVGQWVADQTEQSASWGDFYAMGVERDGEIVAGFVFNNFNDSNATCHIAVTQMTKAFSELLDHGFAYAFGQCGLKRLTGMVEAENEKALKLDKHIGFEEEAVMKQAGSGGQDLHILVLWPQNYRKGKKV